MRTGERKETSRVHDVKLSQYTQLWKVNTSLRGITIDGKHMQGKKKSGVERRDGRDALNYFLFSFH